MTEVLLSDKTHVTLKNITELTPEDEGKRRALEGIVIGHGDIEDYVYEYIIKCSNCKWEKSFAVSEKLPDWRDLKYPKDCPVCNGPTYVDQEMKNMLKRILFAEQGVPNPLSITGFLYGKNINSTQPGNRIRIVGKLRSRKKSNRDLTYQRYFDIDMCVNADTKVVMPTKEELETFKTWTREQIVNSIAPNIRNMKIIKEALFLACLGGVEHQSVRGDVNILLMGDPGVAKTQLLKFMTKIVQKSDYASGRSASGAGLFGGVDNLPDGTRMARSGVVVMCNGGICCLDEMDKMSPVDRVYCHEAMESQTFSLKKIGINQTWEVKTVIIGAANPKKSRWIPELSIKENINMTDALLSRFALIFLIRDIANPTEDREIAEHISMVIKGTLEECISTEMLLKFVNHVKSLKPVMSDEADDLIKEWWITLRGVSQPDESISVDVRTRYDISRLAEAYAKMDLSETVNIEHAKSAINIMQESLKTMNMNTPGERQASITMYVDKNSFMRSIFTHPITREQAIVNMMKEKKWFRTEEMADTEIENYISKYHAITECGDGELKWV